MKNEGCSYVLFNLTALWVVIHFDHDYDYLIYISDKEPESSLSKNIYAYCWKFSWHWRTSGRIGISLALLQFIYLLVRLRHWFSSKIFLLISFSFLHRRRMTNWVKWLPSLCYYNPFGILLQKIDVVYAGLGHELDLNIEYQVISCHLVWGHIL